MAWIVGRVTDSELDTLRRRGWEDEDPPEELKFNDETWNVRCRMFWVDHDVFSIMSGPDWDK